MSNQFLQGFRPPGIDHLEYQKNSLFSVDYKMCMDAQGKSDAVSFGLIGPDAYVNFIERNGMRGLADELVCTVSGPQAEKIIGMKFSQARYDAYEMMALRSYYKLSTRPIVIRACLIESASGLPLIPGDEGVVIEAESFDSFSDGFVHAWQSCWNSENLTYIAEHPKLRDHLRHKNFSVLTWCYSPQISCEASDAPLLMERVPEARAGKPNHHQVAWQRRVLRPKKLRKLVQWLVKST